MYANVCDTTSAAPTVVWRAFSKERPQLAITRKSSTAVKARDRGYAEYFYCKLIR